MRRWVVQLESWSAEGHEVRTVQVLAPDEAGARQQADTPWEVVTRALPA